MVPDEYWREACRNNHVGFTDLSVLPDGRLRFGLGAKALLLPKVDLAGEILRTRKILSEIAQAKEVDLEWSTEVSALKVKWGGCVFLARCSEEFYILHEILVRGDYDISVPTNVIILDVGANVGFTAVYFAASNPAVEVVCFEPFDLNYHRILETLRFNPGIAGRVRINNYGLLDHTGNETIYSRDGARGCSSVVTEDIVFGSGPIETAQVAVRRASEVLREIIESNPGKVLVLKLDCEGSEYRILEDLVASGLAGAISFVVLEWHPRSDRQNGADWLRAFLSRLGMVFYSQSRLSSESGIAVAAWPRGAGKSAIFLPT